MKLLTNLLFNCWYLFLAKRKIVLKFFLIKLGIKLKSTECANHSHMFAFPTNNCALIVIIYIATQNIRKGISVQVRRAS